MWWLVGLVGFVLVTWGAVSARQVLYPQPHPIPAPHLPPAFTTHVVRAPDGVSVPIWRLTHPTARGRLLLCHGYYANHNQVSDLARELHTRGYEVLVMELRGHGSRPGPCTLGLRETDDALAVLAWARSHDASRSLPVGVLGLSMGAAVVCHVAARASEVRAVVVDSIYSRLFPVLRRVIRQRYHLPAIPWAWVTVWGVQLALGRRLSSFDPATLARRLQQPLFAIQGGEDRRVVPLLGREFYQRWAGPKERWFEPTVAHVGMFARHPQAYCDRVAAFFDRTLA